MDNVYQCPKCGYIEKRDFIARKIFGKFASLPITATLKFQVSCEKCGEMIEVEQHKGFSKED